MLSKLLDAFGIGRKRKLTTGPKARSQGYRSIRLPGEDGDIIEARIPNDGGMATFHNVLSQLNERKVPAFDSDGYPTRNAQLIDHNVPCRLKKEPTRQSQPSDTYTQTAPFIASNYSYDSTPSSCDTSTSSSTSTDCSY